MIKKDVVRFYNLLTLLKSKKEEYSNYSLHFRYKNTYNLKKLENEISAIKEVEKPLIELDEIFKTRKLEILKKYAKLDEKGEFILENGQYTFESDEIRNEFLKEFLDSTKDLTVKINSEVSRLEEFHKEPSSINESEFLKYELRELPENFPDEYLDLLIDLNLMIDAGNNKSTNNEIYDNKSIN